MNEKELNIILETRAGSHAYGTNIEGSDEDFRGVAIPSEKYFLGFSNRFEQLEQNKPHDRIIYDIRKFFTLAANCNPNILELLYVDDRQIVNINSLGKKLRENKDLFLSKKARFTYSGYAFSQLKRIKSHRGWLLNPVKSAPARKDFGLPEQKLLSDDQQGAFLNSLDLIIRNSLEESKLSPNTISELREASLRGQLQKANLDESVWHYAQRATGATDNFIEALKKEKAYKAAMDNWRSFQNWKGNRNPKRAALEAKCGYDSKAASHLVRLLRTGREILSGKGVIVFRPDRKELLEIRNGDWSYNKLETYFNKMAQEIDKLYKTSLLIDKPDMKALDHLCVDMVREASLGVRDGT